MDEVTKDNVLSSMKLGVDVVRNVAKEIGVEFPEDYIGFVKKFHGGSPEFEVVDIPERNECVFNRLLSFSKNESTILKVVLQLSDRLPKNLIPIASDPFGNYYCFGYTTYVPKIVLWCYETANKLFVADPFAKMIEMLYLPS